MSEPDVTVSVPEAFYRRIRSVGDMPESYAASYWSEGHFGSWLEASRAQGLEAVETITARLGQPLRLPPWSAEGDGEREAYVYALKTSVDAGLLILIDRSTAQVVLRLYHSWRLPPHARSRPPGLEWEARLMVWFRWLTTPDEKLPPDILAAGATHPFALPAEDERSGVGDPVVVPEQFYAQISDASQLPSGWSDPSWTELAHPGPVNPRAEGLEAVATAIENLGPPMALPPTGSGEPAREGWVFILKAHPEAGLLAVLDRDAEVVELRGVYSDKLSMYVPATPMGDWWPPLLANWWRAQVDPGFEMPAARRPAGPVSGARFGLGPGCSSTDALHLPEAGAEIAVPEHFYARIESADDMPDGYAGPKWGEGHLGNWLEASQARGEDAIRTIVERLGPPLVLAPWVSSGPREAYVYRLQTTDLAGLIILVDRSARRVLLRTYRSRLLPLYKPARPPGLEWGSMLVAWFRWLTTPDGRLPSHIRAAGQRPRFMLVVKGGAQDLVPPVNVGVLTGRQGESGVATPRGKVVVPDHFYDPVTHVERLPTGWVDASWTEQPYPAPVQARAVGATSIATALDNLGPPLVLPPTGAGHAGREGWVFSLKANAEAGLVAVLDRDAQAVELRVYFSERLPANAPAAPMETWWHRLLATWWQAQVDPDFEMPANGRFVDRPPSAR